MFLPVKIYRETVKQAKIWATRSAGMPLPIFVIKTNSGMKARRGAAWALLCDGKFYFILLKFFRCLLNSALTVTTQP